MKLGPVHPLPGPDPWTYGVGPVRTQVQEGQDRPSDSLRTETEPEFWTVQKDCQNSTIVAGMDPEEKNEIYKDIFEENSIVTMDSLRISSVIMTDSRMRSVHISIPIAIKTVTGNQTVETKVLLDTGAEGLFMDRNYAEEHDIVL